MFGVASVIVSIATLWSLAQASGHRTPLITLLLATLCFMVSMIMRVLIALMLRSTSFNFITLYRYEGAHIALNGALTLVLAAAMFVLWNRGTAASSQSIFYPASARSHGVAFKRVWDSFILLGLGAMAVGDGVCLPLSWDDNTNIHRAGAYVFHATG